MTSFELGNILKEMYDKAPHEYKVVNIHLFGIKYVNQIKENNYSATEIVKASGLNRSYATEVSKGMKLSRYVVVKK